VIVLNWSHRGWVISPYAVDVILYIGSVGLIFHVDDRERYSAQEDLLDGSEFVGFLMLVVIDQAYAIMTYPAVHRLNRACFH
jgi:hypothetical protein